MTISVAAYAQNDEVKRAIIESDNIRRLTLDACYAIPGYIDLALKDKNEIYDKTKAALLTANK